MAWNPHSRYSQEEFRLELQTVARETLLGLRTPQYQGKAHPPLWFLNREIRVQWDFDIPRAVVDVIINSMQERIVEVGLEEFTFLQTGQHPTSVQQIAQAIVGRELDEERLFSLALTEVWRNERCGGRQHADVYITNKPFKNDHASWGAARFNHGTVVLSLTGDRQRNLKFLANVARHETAHLLGMYAHCDDYRNVAGFRYTPSCNMHSSCSQSRLCPKCLFFFRALVGSARPRIKLMSMHRSPPDKGGLLYFI